MAKEQNALLFDFRPYEWYDIKLFPAYSLQRYQTGPRCDIIVKRWNPDTDAFEIRKIKDSYYTPPQSGYSSDDEDNTKGGWQGLRIHERVLAFLHDGQDVSTDYTPISDMPVLRDKKISSERRTVKYCNGSSGDCYWQEPYEEQAVPPMLNTMVTHPENGGKFKVEGLNTLDPNNPVVYIRPLSSLEMINV